MPNTIFGIRSSVVSKTPKNERNMISWKNMKNTRRLNNKQILLLMFILAAIFIVLSLCLFFFRILPRLNSQGGFFDTTGNERKHHILVVGQADNSAFLNQVFEGASSLSEQFNSVVEFRAPNLQAENTSLQSLIDYAACVNCDGIIAYVNSQVTTLKKPVKADGTEIPLITIGHYVAEIPQISFIGNNYSNLGRQLAIESEEMAKRSDRTIVVVSGNSSIPNYGNMVNNFVTYYRTAGIKDYEILDKSEKENIERIKEVLRDPEVKKPSIVCLTEEDTINVVYVLTSSSFAHKTEVLGFGENETLEIYLKKGILSKLVSLDPGKMGRTAMMELFEYRTKGYANSYISADIRVRTSK